MKIFMALSLLLTIAVTVSATQATQATFAKSTQHKILDSFMDKSTVELYEAWQFVFNKETTKHSLTSTLKFKNFEMNVNKIKEHNLNKSSAFKMGLNEYSDMSYEEFEKHFNLDYVYNVEQVKKFLEPTELKKEALSTVQPKANNSVDHRNHMMPIRNQQTCGSCWAFSTLGVMEGNYNMKFTEDISLKDHLSVQYSIDCDSGNGGCNGGWYSNSFRFYRNQNAVWESVKPYINDVARCDIPSNPDSFSPARIERYIYTEQTQDDYYLHSMLNVGPISVAVGVDGNWMNYQSGLFDATCPDAINHAVILVGYGYTTNNDGYWIIRNSWGTSWGEAGYMNIKDNKYNNNSCNVASYGFLPVMA